MDEPAQKCGEIQLGTYNCIFLERLITNKKTQVGNVYAVLFAFLYLVQ